MLDSTDLPRGPRGHVTCLPTLQVVDGDRCLTALGGRRLRPGARPDQPRRVLLAQRAARRPAGEGAGRQHPTVVLGGLPKEYRHKYVGSVAGLGLYKGVAHVYGIKVKGLPAWFMHRTYHMSRIPSFNRKVRVVADWTLAFLLKREVISLGQLHEPRAEFVHLARE
jgi:NADH dehydrogenase